MKLFCRHKVREILFCYKTYYDNNDEFKAVYISRCVKCNKLLWYEVSLTEEDLKSMTNSALKYFDTIVDSADRIRNVLLEQKKYKDAPLT